MKQNKAYLVFIPAIGVVTWMLSQWLTQSDQGHVLPGLSSDAFAGIIVGLGMGVMIVLLRQGRCKNQR